MPIWTVYLLTCVIGLIFFLSLPQLIGPLELDLRGIPPPINLILAIDFVAVIIVYSFGAVCFIAIAPVHVLWVLFAIWRLWRNERRTWARMADEFFDRDRPHWLDSPRHTDDERPQDEDLLSFDNGNPDVHERDPLYSNLQLRETNDIRLLEFVSPASESSSSELQFELKVSTMEAARGKYTALSYCWGIGSASKLIYINDMKIMVRLNLYHGLRQLVDDLCINQADADECSKQVLRIEHIFRDSKLVIAWTWTMESHNPEGELDSPAEMGSESLPMSADPTMEEILNTQYWQRMWIVQEFAVARNIQVHVGLPGRGSIKVERLRAKLAEAALQSNKPASLEFVQNAVDIRESYEARKDRNLLDLLIRTSGNVSDRRHDRVFGLLSMALDRRDFITTPSYRTNEREMAMQMTKFYIQGPKSYLDIILLGPYFRSQLPSWCPNYFEFDRLPHDKRVFEYVRDLLGRDRDNQDPGDVDTSVYHRPLFRATKASVRRARFDDQGVLHSEAKPIGKVSSLGWIASDGAGTSYPSSHRNVTTVAMDCDEVATALWQLMQSLSRRDAWKAFREEGVPAAADPTADRDYKTCTYPFVYFMLLAFHHKAHPETENGPDGWYGQWLCRNQSFLLGETSLHEYAAGVSPWNLLVNSDIWQWSQRTTDLFKASITHRELDWKRIHQPLMSIAEQQMRLMALTTDEKMILSLAHPACRPGDGVWLLSGCSVPVILRAIEDDDLDTIRYSVVGDAIVPGAMLGELWTDLPLAEIEIV